MIKYFKFNPHDNTNILPQLIECYKQVFSEEPWNEYKKCQICDTKWGLDEKNVIESLEYKHCNEPIVDFWSTEKVKNKIFKDITPNASCWLAFDNGKVIGFCWGYPTDIQTLNKRFAERGKIKNLAEKIHQQFNDLCLVAYQEEIGVIKQYRRKGIAKELFARRLQDFCSQEIKVGVATVKTKPPSVSYLWLIKFGYEIIAKHNDLDGRVVLIKLLEEIKL